MLAMKICRRWILLLVAGLAIVDITTAASDIINVSPKTTTDNERIFSLDVEDVPGVQPLAETDPLGQGAPTTTSESSLPSSTIITDKALPPSSETVPKINDTTSRQPSSDEAQKPSSEIPSKVNPEKKYESPESRGRALHGNDVTVGGAIAGETVDTRNSLHGNITDLSDVSMDDDDKDIEGGEYLASRNASGSNIGGPAAASLDFLPVTAAGTRCSFGNETYAPGMQIYRGCEERCFCGRDGNLTDCQPLTCKAPLLRSGRNLQDPLCQEKLMPGDPCCVLLVCAEDSEPEPEESCYLGNKTVTRGETVEDGCLQVCVCEAQGKLKCRPRCSSNSTSMPMAASSANQRDKCVPVPDPSDPCCTITLCDVTLGDHEIKPDILPAETRADLVRVDAINSTAIKLTFSNNSTTGHEAVELSTDNLMWKEQKFDKDGIIGNLEPSRIYYVRMVDRAGNGPKMSLQVKLPTGSSSIPTIAMSDTTSSSDQDATGVCKHRGSSYKLGAEWYDDCVAFCTCSMVGNAPKTECATIECPTDFGLDVLDPNCLEWESMPTDFVPIAPRCCSQEVRCKVNGSCEYHGERYDNWSEIPSNVTGCEQRCYCEMGEVSCQSACPPVPALPPASLQCPQSQVKLAHLPGPDECCLHWVCGDPSTATLPGTFGRNGTSAYPGSLATDSINHLQSIDDRKIPGISQSSNPQQWTVTQGLTDRYTTVPRRKYHEIADLDSSSNPDATDDHGRIHYPMDPGHPTTPITTTAAMSPPPPPYHGPYNPNFTPTQPSLEEVFRLTPRTKAETDALSQVPKEKPAKSKTESKKPIEPVKPVKDAVAPGETRFTVPVTPGKQDNSPVQNKDSSALYGTAENTGVRYTPPTIPGPPPRQKNYSSMTDPRQYEVPPSRTAPDENIPPHIQFHPQFDGSVPGLGPLRYNSASNNPNLHAAGPERPNVIGTNDYRGNSMNAFNLGREPKPPTQGHLYVGNSKPNIASGDGKLPEELYRLINRQHPGLIRLNDGPPEAHQGLYGVSIHPGAGVKEHQGLGQGGDMYHPGSLQYFNPQAFAETGGSYENTANGYHSSGQLHGLEVPSATRQHIEELLLHVGEKDPNPGPFQRYPGGPDQPYIRLPSMNGPPLGLDHGLPPGFHVLGGQGGQSSSDQVIVESLQAVSETRVRLVFTVPQVLVGLHGSVEVRYTSDKTNYDLATWKSQAFAPPDNLIATQELEFELDGLAPATEYNVMIVVKLRDVANSPKSKIYNVVTMEATDVQTLPPQLPTDAELSVAEANSTWANIVWRKFTEYEMQFIDGVQLRYKEIEGKIYAATPLIHRAVTSYVIENLKPGSIYEVGIYFIPFPGQPTELVNEKSINFTTGTEPDPYSFDIKVEIKGIKSTEVEVAWKGVPYPEDKYVNIYRAIYQSDTGKEDTSTFKIAKRDSPAKTMIGELKPGTRYRLWIEVYLTNGKTKKSNVQDFVTKPGVPMSAGVLQQQGKLASQVPLHEGDYYGPLVIVAIVASIAILSTLILLMMLMKRRTSSKADISPRKTTAAYDNPSYKVEIQQETMDL